MGGSPEFDALSEEGAGHDWRIVRVNFSWDNGGTLFLRLRRAVALIVLAAALLSSGEAWAQTPIMHGRAAVLIDGSTGQVLFNYNAGVRNYPASTTKLLTALVAVEHGSLDQIITVSAQAIDQPPGSSACYISVGEQQRLEYLLYGLLLSSGNDCADAIAEGLTGGHPGQFLIWMNETARRVGAQDSQFRNPHGLHNPEHYTTAVDLARIARAAMANPVVRRIAGTKEFNWPGKNNGTYYNHNAMLFTYDGTVGGKNGFTEQAGLTLVSSAERDGQFFVGVVLGESSRLNQYDDMKALLDYGFEKFEARQVVTIGTPLGEVTVKNGLSQKVRAVTTEGFQVAAPKGGDPEITVSAKTSTDVTAPVEAGAPLGQAEIRVGGQLLGTVLLVADISVAATPPLQNHVKRWGLSILKGLAWTLLSLIIFRVVVKTIRRMIRRRRKLRRRPVPTQSTHPGPARSAGPGPSP